MRTTLVTGATEGVGRALSAALAGAGHRVIVTAREAAAAEATAATIGEARGLQLDVASARDLETLAERAGPVDVLVNCAGVLLDRDEDPLTVAPGVLEATVRVNLLGPWRVCQALVPGMAERGWGRARRRAHRRVLRRRRARRLVSRAQPRGARGHQPGTPRRYASYSSP